MSITKILVNIAKSKPGQAFYKWASQPKSEQFLNTTLPQVETVLATGCYVWSTARQKNIDKDRKNLLQIQNIGSGIVGLFVSSWANKKISNYGEKLIKQLDTNKIDPKSIRQISSGLRVGLPILTTGICMRFLIPSVIALFSGKMMDSVRDSRKYLDVKG